SYAPPMTRPKTRQYEFAGILRRTRPPDRFLPVLFAYRKNPFLKAKPMPLIVTKRFSPLTRKSSKNKFRLPYTTSGVM
ncbi:hypothetical protein, partial [Escherichia coli]|uniref:hypothetical protein n=2 Tax=Escherichia coli TaxID=562 RepID=UPI001A7E0CD8